MRRKRANQQHNGTDERDGCDAVDQITERAIEGAFAGAMTDHCRDEQNDDDGWQKPNRSENEVARQREIDCADGEKRAQRLPPRFRFIDLVGSIVHARRENRR